MSMRCLGASALALFVAGCGGPKVAPVIAAPPPAKDMAPLSPAPLTPLVAPPELFAVARIQNPARVADTSIAWSALPIDWRSMLSKEAPGLEAVGAYDVPLDMAAMLDPSSGEEPNLLWAVSFGARSVDAAVGFLRGEGGAVTADGSGGYRVRVDPKVACVVSRALGPSPARVVCSDDAAGADAMVPYMTRGLPLEALGPSEVHAHVIAEPFRRRYGSQLALVRTVGVPFGLRELEVDHPKLDRALRDVLYGLADEIIALAFDLDRVDIDLGLAPTGDVVLLSTSLGLSGQRSWWAQTMARAAEHPGVAPDAFWKLPADATSGSFSAYSDPDRVRGIAAALRDLADGWLDYEGLGEKRRTPLVDALEQVLTTGAKSAYATLPVPDPGVTGSPERTAIQNAVGAHLLVIDQGGDRFMKLCAELVKALGDRAFREHLAKQKVFSEVPLPTARERAPQAVKGLPAGSRVYELTLPLPPSRLGEEAMGDDLGSGKTPRKKALAKKTESLSVVIVVAPDGPLTWFGFGTDEKLLVTKLAESRAGSAATLETRDGLVALRTEPGLSAGFSSLAAMASRLGPSLFLAEEKFGGPNALLGRLPHRGTTPMLWRVGVGARGPKLTGTVHVPKGVVEDLVALAASHVPLHR